MTSPDYFGFVATAELPSGHCSRIWTDGLRVLKVPFQGEEMTTGRLAAERISGWPGVHVYGSHAPSGALLMERLGEPLSSAWRPEDDDSAINVFLKLALAMRNVSSEEMTDLGSYVGASDPLAMRLLETVTERTFLHGDLHHENILRDQQESVWLAIDPKGLCGDPAYEAVAYVRNPTGLMQGVTDMDRFLHHRIELLSRGLYVPASRVWAWSLVDLQGEAHRQDSDRFRILHTLRTMTDYVLE